MKYLDNWKTYLASAGMVITTILFLAGVLDFEQFIAGETIFGGTAMASLRHAIKKGR